MAAHDERQNLQVVSSLEIRANALKVEFVNITLPEGSKVEPVEKPLWIRFDGAQLRIKPGGLG